MDENDDENEEVYMYPVDMHLDEWDGYQEIVHASNATEWERQQYEIVVGSKRKTGESSCPSGAPTMQKSQKMRKYCGRDIIRPGATRALDSHQEVDSISAGQNSRPSAIGTFASSYDGSRDGTNDESDNARGDIGERQYSQYPMSQFTRESDFTHYTQNEDHGFRRASPGIETIGKPYIGKERTMTPYNEELFSKNFESMSIGTQFSDSLNEANVYPPYVMGYDQPSSSTDEEYCMLSYPSDAQMSY
ncbi:hypothetical protein CK203_100576 [Vitis vinifera]|uniref:Uncharacterized protein n=1 Tax=Vitis vinifera TaxID=29760 RepID=A0A438CZ98_VITVI|nr:hypothetical protein CK203_100576 [Vitis vinifera]